MTSLQGRRKEGERKRGRKENLARRRFFRAAWASPERREKKKEKRGKREKEETSSQSSGAFGPVQGGFREEGKKAQTHTTTEEACNIKGEEEKGGKKNGDD